MPSKQIVFDTQARQLLLAGVTKLTKAVAATLGPKGRNVAIDKKFGSPHVTKDGVSVAREIELEDPFENMGAQMVREVASRTSITAGDGTTTATILAESIFREGIRYVTGGANPIGIQRGIQKAVDAVVAKLDTIKADVKEKSAIAQVATVSANWDASIGNLIAEAFERIGKDGTITVEEAKGFETTLSVVEGMQFDRGYVSPYFLPQGATEVKLEDAYILLTPRNINAIKEIKPILERVAQTKKPLLIIAEECDGEALGTLIINKHRGILNSCAVKVPGFGDRKKAMLEDIAVLTGGSMVNDELGQTLEKTQLAQLGKAATIIITKESTTIIGGAGTKENVEARLELIRRQSEASTSEYEKERFQERLSKLTGGVAVINVGAATETEMKEKKDRVDDALHATRAAIEEGIVAGGGVALLRCICALDGLSGVDIDETYGIDIVRKSLSYPTRVLARNAGIEGADIVSATLREHSGNVGYNVATGVFEDLVLAGVVDPKKVTRSALQNAASIAGLLLTTECLITEIPEKAEKIMSGPQPGIDY